MSGKHLRTPEEEGRGERESRSNRRTELYDTLKTSFVQIASLADEGTAKKETGDALSELSKRMIELVGGSLS